LTNSSKAKTNSFKGDSEVDIHKRSEGKIIITMSQQWKKGVASAANVGGF